MPPTGVRMILPCEVTTISWSCSRTLTMLTTLPLRVVTLMVLSPRPERLCER